MEKEKCTCGECGENVSDFMYIHSKCCECHWELCKDKHTYFLACEKCGKTLRRLQFIESDDVPLPKCVSVF